MIVRDQLVSLLMCVSSLRFVLCNDLLRMVAHAFLIVSAAAPVRYLLVALTVCAARKIEIGGIAASFSRIRLFTALYAPRTVRRLLF